MKNTYQEAHFEQIAEAIRYVYSTNEKIPAVDFYKWIRALKSMIDSGGGLSGNCRLGDNIPNGCGDVHGLVHLDFTLVNCVTEKLRDNLKFLQPNTCLCDDNWAYGPPTCSDLHGLLHLDFSVIDCNLISTVVWGYY